MNSNVRIRSKELECLRPILNEWVALNIRLGKEWAAVDDAPWWHIERALVSLLAGAIWRCKGDAFEEYAEVKPGKKEGAAGRIDLWFSYRGEDYKAEAKQCWVKAHTSAKALNQVIKVMERACRDAENLNSDGMRRLAIVFGAVLFPKKHEAELGKLINRSIKLAAQKQIKSDAFAWVFPKLNPPPTSSDGYIVPGIIVWVKEVPDRRKRRGTQVSMNTSKPDSRSRHPVVPKPSRFVWTDSDIEFVSEKSAKEAKPKKTK